jgi:ParB family chromosome partitioning protein
MQQLSNRKLGRGISALIGDSINENVARSGNNVSDVIKSITMDKIVAGIYQPRTYFDEAKLVNLSKSIVKNGIIQPIVVRRADASSDLYEIIAGERRYRASKLAGLKEIPVIVKDVSNAKALEFAIIENIQRDDLSAIEEAKGYKQLLDEFGYTQEKVANKLGKSRSYIANTLRLLNLPEEIKKMVDEGQISASHARNLLGKDNALLLAQEIVKKSLSVRDLEELSADYQPILEGSGSATILESEEELGQKALRKQYLKTLEQNFTRLSGDLKVKANYDNKKQKGRVTIYYSDFEEIENLLNKLEK